MAKLTEEEKRELLEDSKSVTRRNDFSKLRSRAVTRRLSPAEFVEFLDWAQQFMTEDPRNRPPIKGDTFLL